MRNEKSPLMAGVYEKDGRYRTLLGMVDNKCVYGFGMPRQFDLRITSCSEKTFARSVGDVPFINIERDQTFALAKRATSLRSRRRCNRWERELFFTDAGRRRLIEAVLATSSEQKVESSSFLRKVWEFVKSILGFSTSAEYA